MRLNVWIGCASLVLLLLACQTSEKQNGKERLLARVYGKELYISEMDGMFPEGTNPEDSTLIINAFVNRWIREALLLHEAERNLPKDLNIDKLVRDYRASLIRNNYEQVLVEQLLDSTVTQAELQEFYERNKDQYQLETTILRCYFIKVPIPVPQLDSLSRWWHNPDEKNMAKLHRYCERAAVAHLLKDNTWYRIDDIAAALPKGTLTEENINSRKEFRESDGEHQYFFRLLELKNQKEIAPLGYIEEQARKYILHLRKLKLLEEKKEDLYEVALRHKDVQLFTE